MLTDRQQLGLTGEALAAEWLEQLGWRILDRRFRSGHRDIDIIASCVDTSTREPVIVFIEVRTRRSNTFCHPIETVQRKKQLSVRRAARAWLQSNRRSGYAYRFDLIGIVLQTSTHDIEHIPNAF